MQNGALLIAAAARRARSTTRTSRCSTRPYLFTTVNGKTALAPRPQIVSLSTVQLQHGQSMQVELTSQNGLSQVVLVGLSATTHASTRPTPLPRRLHASRQRRDRAGAGFGQRRASRLLSARRDRPEGRPLPGVIIALGAASPRRARSRRRRGHLRRRAGRRRHGWRHGRGHGWRHRDRNGRRDGQRRLGRQPAIEQLHHELPHQRQRHARPRHPRKRGRQAAGNLPDGRGACRLGRVVPGEHECQPVPAPPELPALAAAQRRRRPLQAGFDLHPACAARRQLRLQHRHLHVLRVGQLAGLLPAPRELHVLRRQAGWRSHLQPGRLVLRRAAGRRFGRHAGEPAIEQLRHELPHQCRRRAKLVIPANATDRQQASFRQVPGLAGSGVSFQASTDAGQYLRHQNFQIWQQANDGGDIFKRARPSPRVPAFPAIAAATPGLHVLRVAWTGRAIICAIRTSASSSPSRMAAICSSRTPPSALPRRSSNRGSSGEDGRTVLSPSSDRVARRHPCSRARRLS